VTHALSVVIPVQNEEGNVAPLADALHRTLAAAGIADYEVLFVDDGSTDGTARAVKVEIGRDRRVRLVSLARNSGQTAAIDAGFSRARGDVIVVMDGDLQNDPADIPVLLAEIGRYDCVCGYRHARGEGDGLVRIVSSRVANAVRTAVLGDPVRDSGCGFRAVRREALAGIKLYRGMHRFLPTLLRLEGRTVAEVPVGNRPRRSGRSKYGVWNRAFAALYDLVAVRWMRSHALRWEVVEEA